MKSSKSAKVTVEVPHQDQSVNGGVVDDVPMADHDDGEVSNSTAETTETQASPPVADTVAENAHDEKEGGVADQSPTVIQAILSQTEVLAKKLPMDVPEFEGSDEVFTVEENIQDILNAEKEATSPVDATFNVYEAVDGTFVVQAVPDSPGAEQEIQAEEESETVDATFNVDEAAVDETYNIAPDPAIHDKKGEDSDADAESEALEDVQNSEGKSKSLRKTRTLSLQKKRALNLSTESDSDSTATPPATKNRKVDKTLTKTGEKVTIPATSAQKVPTTSILPESSLLTRVTRSKSQSVSESSSDSTPVPRSRSSMRRSSRWIRKSSVSASLLKVSAAKGASVSELLATQEVVLVKPVSNDAAIPSP